MKTLKLAISLAVLGFVGGAQAQDVKPAADWCKPRLEADCTAAAACKWVPAMTWTADNGQTRKQTARCRYDAKAARVLLANQFDK